MQSPEEALVDHERIHQGALPLIGAVPNELQQVGVLQPAHHVDLDAELLLTLSKVKTNIKVELTNQGRNQP